MSEPDNSSTTSNERKKKKMTLKIHGTIIMGALLVSIVGLVSLSSAVITISLLSPITTAAFATTMNGGDITCDGQPATIIGTSRADNIVGTSGRDVVAALAGFDRVSGNGGDDLVCGGSANDQLNGGDGNDRIFGESGNDVLAGDSGRDQLVGNSGIDRANGGEGNDICNAETEISCDESDTTPPVLRVPEDRTVEADRPEGAVVGFEVSAEDDVDGQLAARCTPESGSTFSIGTTTVTCTATDAAGNRATETFRVTVQDTTAPSLDVPEDITVVDTNGDGSEVVTFEVTAQDDVDGPVEVTCDSNLGDTFEVGETVVTCSAEDAAGNRATETFRVTVNPPPDTTAPSLDVPDNMRVFPPCCGSTVVVTWEVTAQDNVDGTATLDEDNTLTQDNVGGDITISCRPPSGSGFSIGVEDHSVTCTATDAAGNTATAFFRINTQL